MSRRLLTIADLEAHPEHIAKYSPYTVEELRKHPLIQKFANAPDMVLRYAENYAQNNGDRMLLEGIQAAREIVRIQNE